MISGWSNCHRRSIIQFSSSITLSSSCVVVHGLTLFGSVLLSPCVSVWCTYPYTTLLQLIRHRLDLLSAQTSYFWQQLGVTRILVIAVCLLTAKPIAVLSHLKQHPAERVTYKQSQLSVSPFLHIIDPCCHHEISFLFTFTIPKGILISKGTTISTTGSYRTCDSVKFTPALTQATAILTLFITTSSSQIPCF